MRIRTDWLLRMVFAAMGDGGAGGGADAAATTTADAEAAAAAATAAAPDGGQQPKWWEGLPDLQKAYLTPKGLTLDDPAQAAAKLIDIASNAEKRIGKGLDSIMDRPGKDQPYADWAKANAETLGLPKEAAGYEVKPPADWPKDLPWDAAAEAQVREIALQHGVHPEAHKAYVAFQAQMVRELDKAATEGLAAARTEMMAELQRDWGQQTQAKVTRAAQAMQVIAEKAGLSTDHVLALSQSMSAKTGDAGVLRLFDTIADLMADDTGLAMGRGSQQLGTTPAEARAELARFQGPEGEYGKALAAGDQRKMKELAPRREQLARLAAGG